MVPTVNIVSALGKHLKMRSRGLQCDLQGCCKTCGRGMPGLRSKPHRHTHCTLPNHQPPDTSRRLPPSPMLLPSRAKCPGLHGTPQPATVDKPRPHHALMHSRPFGHELVPLVKAVHGPAAHGIRLPAAASPDAGSPTMADPCYMNAAHRKFG